MTTHENGAGLGRGKCGGVLSDAQLGAVPVPGLSGLTGQAFADLGELPEVTVDVAAVLAGKQGGVPDPGPGGSVEYLNADVGRG